MFWEDFCRAYDNMRHSFNVQEHHLDLGLFLCLLPNATICGWTQRTYSIVSNSNCLFCFSRTLNEDDDAF
jgi:hypothetical protein